MHSRHGRFDNSSLVLPMMLLWFIHHLVSMCLQGGPQATPALPAAGRPDHSITGGAAALLHAGALPCLWPTGTADRCSLLLYVSPEHQHAPSCMCSLYSPREPQANPTYVGQGAGAATTFRPINAMALPVYPNGKAAVRPVLCLNLPGVIRRVRVGKISHSGPSPDRRSECGPVSADSGAAAPLRERRGRQRHLREPGPARRAAFHLPAALPSAGARPRSAAAPSFNV